MKQITRHTGDKLRFNLDPESGHAMKRAQAFHTGNGHPVSNSVIVRRALRLYGRTLSKLNTPEAVQHETLETLRAAKGVL